MLGIIRGAVCMHICQAKMILTFIKTEKLLNLVGDWKSYLLESQHQRIEEFAKRERTGRPLGSEHFLEMVESLLGHDLKKKKPGPRGNRDN